MDFSLPIIAGYQEGLSWASVSMNFLELVQATLLNPDMCNPDFRLNRTNWKIPVTSYTYNSYTHNSDFA